MEEKYNFKQWNDTSIAHLCLRLITKSNHPLNAAGLSKEQYNCEYELFKKYLNWHKTNYKSYGSDYDFSYNKFEVSK